MVAILSDRDRKMKESYHMAMIQFSTKELFMQERGLEKRMEFEGWT